MSSLPPHSPAACIGRFASKRILVIGDLMLDEFIWGRVSRISPEAPVPVVNVSRESAYPGGAANVARNVHEFTRFAAVMGRVGPDAAGRRLLELLAQKGMDSSTTVVDTDCPTAVKTRIFARSQQVVRVDREATSPLPGKLLAEILRSLDAAIDAADAVIVADYGKGFLGQELADRICRAAAARGRILTVDPHPRTSLVWRGAAAIKPNRTEAFLAAGLPYSEPAEEPLEDRPLLEAGRRLLDLWRPESLIITLGEQGLLLLAPGATPYHTPARAKEVFDVSGAGDTAIAALTLALASGASPKEAAGMANAASGVVVGKIGTATVTPAELAAALES